MFETFAFFENHSNWFVFYSSIRNRISRARVSKTNCFASLFFLGASHDLQAEVSFSFLKANVFVFFVLGRLEGSRDQIRSLS